jgi:hypothetical protein
MEDAMPIARTMALGQELASVTLSVCKKKKK